MTELGEAALIVAFVLALYAAAAAFLSACGGAVELWLSARNGMLVVLGLTSLASVALLSALFSRDFSLRYVYEYTSSDLPGIYTFSAWWAGLSGSLLLWAWLLAVFAGVVLWQRPQLLPYITSVIATVLAFFLGLLSFVANPFERLPTRPAEGLGLNPLLENPGMFFHPPTLYLGYVGFTIPFAFAIAALITGRLGDQWIQASRRWTLFAWFFLGMGNLFGAWWAYQVLGWGGYWGWDPVENASFMPWLVGTAYLHSVMIQQKRGMLKVWNMALIITTFALSLFGTFLTRSGVLSSVHAFSESGLGALFIAFIAVVAWGSLGLLWWRLPQLRGEHELDALLSREASFLLNNLVLVGAAFAIFWGTIFPLISEAVRGVKIAVGPPFYNQVTGPIFLVLIALMGVCPLIGWRKASLRNLARNFLYPLGASLVVAALLAIQGVQTLYILVAFWALSFVGFTLLLEFYRGVRYRHRGHGDNYLAALPRLIWSNRPRYGGYVIHLGVIVMALGIVVSTAYSTSAEAVLAPGESMVIQQYELTFIGLDRYSTGSKDVTAASVAVSNGGSPEGTMVSKKYLHRNHPNPVTQVDIRSVPLEDLYLILNNWTEDGRVTLKALVNPMVGWIWIGGGVLLVGTVIAFWPDPRERRRLAMMQAEVSHA